MSFKEMILLIEPCGIEIKAGRGGGSEGSSF